MAADLEDNFKKVGPGTVTTLAAPGKALAAESINVGSTTNYPTDTGIIIAIRTVDTNGELVSGTYTEWKATVSSATSLIIDATPVYGDDQIYAAGSTTQVYIPTSAYAQNDLVDGILIEHHQNGKQKNSDGWQQPLSATGAVETWTYASATTITVPTGAASKYSVGDKIKLTANSVVLYAYIITVADELLTVAGNALTEHTFSANYYSKASSPLGFPQYFTYTPTPSNNFASWVAGFGRYSIVGRTLSFEISGTGTTSSSTTIVMLTCPVTPVNAASGKNVVGHVLIADSGYKSGHFLIDDTGKFEISKYDGAVFADGSGKGVYMNGKYEI